MPLRGVGWPLNLNPVLTLGLLAGFFSSLAWKTTKHATGDLDEKNSHICWTLFWAAGFGHYLAEVAQIFRNRQLVRTILVPPTVLLLLYGFALNPEFQNLKVGITDYSNSSASREFEVFDQSDAFVISQYYASGPAMTDALAKGSLTVGITIPPEYGRHCLWAHSPSAGGSTTL